MRLIDADELLKDKVSNAYISRFEIESMPTIDAEPVVHGHWIEKSDGAELQLVCEKCGYDYIEADPDCIERHNFCPNCGAKMDEEVKK